MKKIMFNSVLMIVLYTTGIFIIGNYDGYYDALGVFLMFWGSNVERSIKNEKK